jgi:hypothetical protein
MDFAETIFDVFYRHFTTAAKCTGGEVKVPKALP